MNRASDDVASTAASWIILALTAGVLVFLAIPILLGIGVIHKLLSKPEVEASAETKPEPLPPHRMFGAPPVDQWTNAYEYWLFRLENVTGISFSTSPTRLMVGALIVSIGPALLVSLPLLALDPVNGFHGALIITGAGLLIGLFSGKKLMRPVTGWFERTPSSGASGQQSDLSGFILGEDEW